MKKLYSFLSLFFCLIFIGNLMAADVTLPVNGKFYKIRSVDPTASSAAYGKYMTNQRIPDNDFTEVSLKSVGDVLLAQFDGTNFKFQHLLTGKYMSYTGGGWGYVMSWQETGVDGTKFVVTDKTTYSTIARANGTQYMFWDRTSLGVFNDGGNIVKARWIFEEVEGDNIEDILIDVYLGGLITEAESALALEGVYGEVEKEALENALSEAKTFEGGDVDEIRAFITGLNLSKLIEDYIASKSISLDTNKVYYIVSKNGYYVGRADENVGTNVTLRSTALNNTAYPILIISTEAASTYNFQRYGTEEFLTTDGGWTAYFKPQDSNVDIVLSEGDSPYYKLKFKSKGYFAPDSQAENTGIWTDKAESSSNNQWELRADMNLSLANIIAKADVLVEENYTAATWSIFSEKLTTAKEIDPTASAEAKENAFDELIDGIAQLVDISSLQQLVASANELVGNDYTLVSWSTFQRNLEAARTALESATTQDAVDLAEGNLQGAMDGLIDISSLSTLITSVKEDYIEENYTSASWGSLQSALTLAEEAVPTIASQEEVSQEIIKLQTAVDNLVDISILKAQIAAVTEELVEEDYSLATWSDFSNALDDAETALTATTQEVVNNAVLNLDRMKTALVNVKDLKTLIATAESKEEDDYTIDSWSSLQTALTAANTAVETAMLENAVTVALNNLQTAIGGLVEKVPDSLNELSEMGISIYVANQKLYISGLNAEVAIAVYDLSGRSIFNEVVSGSQFVKELSAGSYIINLSGYVNGSTIIIVK